MAQSLRIQVNHVPPGRSWIWHMRFATTNLTSERGFLVSSPYDMTILQTLSDINLIPFAARVLDSGVQTRRQEVKHAVWRRQGIPLIESY